MAAKKTPAAAEPPGPSSNDNSAAPKRGAGLCGLGKPCERDRVNAPEQLDKPQVDTLRLCPEHRAILLQLARK